jgi:transposase
VQATIIGFDIAKNVFQIYGEDASGKKVPSKRLKRDATEEFFAKLPPTVIGIEACGSSHHWGRLLSAMGHEVRLIPPGYVKPFVKRNKTDARDAEAICEAIRRPSMRFEPVKTVDQQSGRALENARGMLVRQRTQLMNAIRGMLAEVGVRHRQLIVDRIVGSAIGRAAAVDRRDHAAIATPVTSAQAVNVWLRSE